MNGEPLIFIGRTKWRDLRKPFGLRPRDRQAHMYVIGKTGTGKSSLLEAMIRQDVMAGNGLALFDPHGDLAERLYAWIPESRKADLIYLNVPDPEQPFGFNPLENVPPLKRSLVANGITETLKKLFDDAWGSGSNTSSGTRSCSFWSSRKPRLQMSCGSSTTKTSARKLRSGSKTKR